MCCEFCNSPLNDPHEEDCPHAESNELLISMMLEQDLEEANLRLSQFSQEELY